MAQARFNTKKDLLKIPQDQILTVAMFGAIVDFWGKDVGMMAKTPKSLGQLATLKGYLAGKSPESPVPLYISLAIAKVAKAWKNREVRDGESFANHVFHALLNRPNVTAALTTDWQPLNEAGAGQPAAAVSAAASDSATTVSGGRSDGGAEEEEVEAEFALDVVTVHECDHSRVFEEQMYQLLTGKGQASDIENYRVASDDLVRAHIQLQAFAAGEAMDEDVQQKLVERFDESISLFSCVHKLGLGARTPDMFRTLLGVDLEEEQTPPSLDDLNNVLALTYSDDFPPVADARLVNALLAVQENWDEIADNMRSFLPLMRELFGAKESRKKRSSGQQGSEERDEASEESPEERHQKIATLFAASVCLHGNENILPNDLMVVMNSLLPADDQLTQPSVIVANALTHIPPLHRIPLVALFAELGGEMTLFQEGLSRIRNLATASADEAREQRLAAAKPAATARSSAGTESTAATASDGAQRSAGDESAAASAEDEGSAEPAKSTSSGLGMLRAVTAMLTPNKQAASAAASAGAQESEDAAPVISEREDLAIQKRAMDAAVAQVKGEMRLHYRMLVAVRKYSGTNDYDERLRAAEAGSHLTGGERKEGYDLLQGFVAFYETLPASLQQQEVFNTVMHESWVLPLSVAIDRLKVISVFSKHLHRYAPALLRANAQEVSKVAGVEFSWPDASTMPFIVWLAEHHKTFFVAGLPNDADEVTANNALMHGDLTKMFAKKFLASTSQPADGAGAAEEKQATAPTPFSFVIRDFRFLHEALTQIRASVEEMQAPINRYLALTSEQKHAFERTFRKAIAMGMTDLKVLIQLLVIMPEMLTTNEMILDAVADSAGGDASGEVHVNFFAICFDKLAELQDAGVSQTELAKLFRTFLGESIDSDLWSEILSSLIEVRDFSLLSRLLDLPFAAENKPRLLAMLTSSMSFERLSQVLRKFQSFPDELKNITFFESLVTTTQEIDASALSNIREVFSLFPQLVSDKVFVDHMVAVGQQPDASQLLRRLIRNCQAMPEVVRESLSFNAEDAQLDFSLLVEVNADVVGAKRMSAVMQLLDHLPETSALRDGARGLAVAKQAHSDAVAAEEREKAAAGAGEEKASADGEAVRRDDECSSERSDQPSADEPLAKPDYKLTVGALTGMMLHLKVFQKNDVYTHERDVLQEQLPLIVNQLEQLARQQDEPEDAVVTSDQLAQELHDVEQQVANAATQWQEKFLELHQLPSDMLNLLVNFPTDFISNEFIGWVKENIQHRGSVGELFTQLDQADFYDEGPRAGSREVNFDKLKEALKTLNGIRQSEVIVGMLSEPGLQKLSLANLQLFERKMKQSDLPQPKVRQVSDASGEEEKQHESAEQTTQQLQQKFKGFLLAFLVLPQTMQTAAAFDVAMRELDFFVDEMARLKSVRSTVRDGECRIMLAALRILAEPGRTTEIVNELAKDGGENFYRTLLQGEPAVNKVLLGLMYLNGYVGSSEFHLDQNPGRAQEQFELATARDSLWQPLLQDVGYQPPAASSSPVARMSS